MSEENKALIRRYYEDTRRNPDLCDEIFSSKIHWHTLQHAAHADFDTDPQDEKVVYQQLDAVWGDWSMTVDEMIAEDERVMVRWTFHGRQQGEYQGLPPTKKTATYAGINIFRIENGKIAEVWDIFDRLWLWQQLGVLPEINAAIALVRESIMAQDNEKTG